MVLLEYLLRGIRDVVGATLGHADCKLTGDNHWKNQLVDIPYAPGRGTIISARALDKFDEATIAHHAWRKGCEQKIYEETDEERAQYFTVEEIIAKIPECEPYSL
ncbi:hypothetical protein CL618_03635 [archaeon]|nr:hypothetical protein [archaeon]